MAIFTCLAMFLAGKKNKNMGRSDGKFHVKPNNISSPSTKDGIKGLHFTASEAFSALEERSSSIPNVPSNDRLARAESAGDVAYEGGDEHDEIQSMKRDYSDFDLQGKGEFVSHGSNTDLRNNYASDHKMETNEGIAPEKMFASGHVSDPGMEQPVFLASPVLKRSCSNIEIKRASKSLNSSNRSRSYHELKNLSRNNIGQFTYETHSSPLSVKSSYSADYVILKKHSSCQVLPSRCRKIWWKFFLWSHRNLQKPNAPQKLAFALTNANQKFGYSSDTHELVQKLDKQKKSIDSDKQWFQFSLQSSPQDRVYDWVNSLDDCTLCPIDDEETCGEKEDEWTAGPYHMEIGESSWKTHSQTMLRTAKEVTQANTIIQSLNSFSYVAHISSMGLKVIPSISAFGNLRYVSLSGNFIAHITSGCLPKHIHSLDLSRNKISAIAGLKDLTRLRVLNLSYNRISRIGHELSRIRKGSHPRPHIAKTAQGESVVNLKLMVSSSSDPVGTPHAVLLSFPAQGHLNPILTLAKILHIVGGFRITIVNTEYNHRRLLRSSASAAAAANNAIDGFRLTAIPDGLPPNPVDTNATRDVLDLCVSTRQHCPAFFRHLLSTLSPPATCVIADGSMSSSAAVAVELGIPAWLFYTHSSCGFWSYVNLAEVVRRGYSPLKDESFLTNGYLDTKIEVIPGMKGIRLRELPTFIRTTNPADLMLQIMLKRPEEASCGVGIILNTFDALEPDVLAAVRFKFGNVYSIGPLTKFKSLVATDSEVGMIGSSLWKNDSECLNWLDGQEQGKVVYVNFGSIAVLSQQQLAEFAWGLAGSGYPILWAIRPDMVSSCSVAEALPEDFVKQVEERTKVVAWCDQEAVLAHPAIGVFLTHCGWNSTLESLCDGVPMVCWPFFAEQPTNCRYICEEWGVGLEIEGEVKRERVEKLVREAMEGEKGMEMKRRALEWKEKARRATEPGGSSYANVEKLMRDLIQTKVSGAEIISTTIHYQNK